LNGGRRKTATRAPSSDTKTVEHRTEIERDFDRILFCTPVRRMADKTQVFPLDRNDSVRNRLTHSHEVSNLARSLGTSIAYNPNLAISQTLPTGLRDIPALLAAIGLVHDLGNPPFGHQGEAAIQSWFHDHADRIHGLRTNNRKDADLYRDFQLFEGNAQTFRLVTRLQLLNDNFGLDLTFASLAAMMKYPTGAAGVSAKKIATKKHGFFASERAIAEEVWTSTGLGEGLRHPFAYVMEASDDIAYAVLDVEDAVKKGLASYSDLISHLSHNCGEDELTCRVIDGIQKKHAEYRNAKLSPAELNDVSMQRFRVFAIGEMVNASLDTFLSNVTSFVTGKQKKPLLEISKANILCESLKGFAFTHAFRHKSVLEVELKGHNTIRALMDLLWEAISETEPGDPKSIPNSPLNRYVFSRISENYRRVYQYPSAEVALLPAWYNRCILMTDMVSGMTDSYAISLLEELLPFKESK
jgi:dGTPase